MEHTRSLLTFLIKKQQQNGDDDDGWMVGYANILLKITQFC